MTRAGAKAKVGTKAIEIFQIHFQGDQLHALDPAFSAYDNSDVYDERLEFGVFETLALRPALQKHQAWGAVSWRFGEKTGLVGQDLLQIVKAHPGVELFYMNVAPVNEALFDSGWMQGEVSHPGLLELAEAVYSASGHDPQWVSHLESSSQFSTANYFVGTPLFWKVYLPFVRSILQVAEHHLPLHLKQRLHTNADPKGLHHGATHMPFVVERLLPLFLSTVGKKLNTHKVHLPAREAELHEHIHSLRYLKDQAIEQQSNKLLQTWRGYRNLYLQQVARPAWCKKYLPWMNGPQWQQTFE